MSTLPQSVVGSFPNKANWPQYSEDRMPIDIRKTLIYIVELCLGAKKPPGWTNSKWDRMPKKGYMKKRILLFQALSRVAF